MKQQLFAFLALISSGFAACNNSTPEETNVIEDNSVTTSTKKEFMMQYKSNTPELQEKKAVTLHFTPKIKGQETEQVALESGHGKKVNLMIVNDDLSQFYQLWPEYQADGSYAADFTFPNGGKFEYILVYKPGSNNGEKIIENIPVTVMGKGVAANTYNETVLTDEADDGYSLTLTVKQGYLKANANLQMEGIVKLNGKEVDVSKFDAYQDGKANMVILKTSNKSYEHSHSDAVNGRFDFRHTFKEAGSYRAFAQFQVADKIYTTYFTFIVTQ